MGKLVSGIILFVCSHVVLKTDQHEAVIANGAFLDQVSNKQREGGLPHELLCSALVVIVPESAGLHAGPGLDPNRLAVVVCKCSCMELSPGLESSLLVVVVGYGPALHVRFRFHGFSFFIENLPYKNECEAARQILHLSCIVFEIRVSRSL